MAAGYRKDDGRMDKSLFDNLTAEQKASLREAKTPEEVMKIVEEEGFDLTVEQLEELDLSGGWASYNGNWAS